MARKSTAALLLAVLLAVAGGTTAAAQAGCRAGYGSRNLLFGGVNSQCKSGCKSRDSEWGRICSGAAGAWGTCTPQQTQAVVDVAKQISGGAMLDFSPCDLEPYLRGRTLWLLGDSFTKQTYRALQCFLIDFWDHQECEASPDASAVQALMRLPTAEGKAKCFHLSGPQGGRVCFAHAVLGTSLLNNPSVAGGGVLPLLRSRFARRQDIFMVNFGFWHRKKPTDWSTFQPALHALGKDHQATRGQWPHLLWKETPAEHPVSGATCAPLSGYTFQPSSGQVERRSVQVERASRAWDLSSAWSNTNVPPRAILPSYGVSVVPGFNPSVVLPSAHVGARMSPKTDCMHYCHPGVPEMNVWFLYEAFRSGAAGIKPLPASVKQANTCVRSTTAGFKVRR